jgi:nitrogen fixation/metabolism regulation signal transduction histidine kinase
MAFRRFSAFLGLRLVVVGIAASTAAWLVIQPGFHGLSAIALVVVALLATELWWYVSRTNREVSRFLESARHADFSQRFDFENVGAGFEELADTFSEILERMSALREDQEVELRRVRAMIEHTPVPLLTVHGDDSITLQNNAARRLFGVQQVTRLRDLRQFGAGFHRAVDESVPGARELVTFTVDDIEYKLTLATTENMLAGEPIRLVSLQDIQSELDETQAHAWQELVSVLTHEIMNSITPVRSLAATASEVAVEMSDKVDNSSPVYEDLRDLRDAVQTLERRSANLMEFVSSYRQLARLAPPEKMRLPVAEIFDSVRRLAIAEWPDGEQRIATEVRPAGLDVHADPVLLEPVLINLLRNAWQATEGMADARIGLCARLNRRGNVVIEISDNGPGVPDDIARKIFVPFFTTKPQGSGVGLALARQVMIAHGGFIQLGVSVTGGARFSLTF